MKVSFKPCVHRHRQRKDKTFSVIIRIGYKSKYAYLETDYYVHKNDLNKKLEIKNQSVINKCNAIITKYSEILTNIDDSNINNVKDIVSIINKNINTSKEIDFIHFFDNYIFKLKDEKSRSIQLYSATYNHLINFIKSNTYPVNRINSKFLTEFENYLKSNNVGSRGQNLYMGKIRAVYNLIIDEYEEYGYTFNYPFRKYKLPQVKAPKTIALTKEQLLSIITVNLKNKLRANKARLSFITSLLTLGTNAADLYDLNCINKNRIEYKRNKTKDRRLDEAFISIKIEPELLPYLDILKGKDEYIFCFREWYKNKPQFNKGINKGLEQVAKVLNENYKKKIIMELLKEGKTEEEINRVSIDNFIHDFDFYDARRTMASIMRNKLGISKDDVAMCLNHVDINHKTTDQYIEVDFSLLDKCNRKFLDWLFEK